MPLIACPECGGKLSTAAESCPHCGHPNELVTRKQSAELPTEDKCYACDRPATQKCPRCSQLSCAQHLEKVWGAGHLKVPYPLACRDCKVILDEQHQGAANMLVILAIVGLLIPALIVAAKGCAR